MLLEIYNSITSKSIENSDSAIDKKRIRFLTTLSFTAILLQPLLGTFSYINNIGLLINVSFILMGVVTLLTIKYGHWRDGRFLFIMWSVANCAIINLWYGKMAGSDIGLVFIILCSLLLVDKLSTGMVLVFTSMVCYFSIWFLSPSQQHIYAHLVEPDLYNITLILLMMAILISTHFFIKELRNYETETTALISKVQKANIKLNQQKDLIDSKDERINQFAYFTTHEIKSELRRMGAFTQLLRKSLREENNSNVHDYIDIISNSSKELHDTARELLQETYFDKTA